MARVWLVLSIVGIAFIVFSFVSVVLTEKWRVRGVPKLAWLAIVILLPPVGGILWFLLGRERASGRREASGQQGRPVHPDDDPEFLARMRAQKEQDERIARLERELADLDDDQPEKK